MAASVKLVLRQDKTRADGTAPVYIRITANRKSRFLATGVTVTPRDWNDRRQDVRASHELSKALNRRLQDQLNDARLAALDAPTATAAKVAIVGPSGSLSAYFDRHVARLEAAGKHSQIVHFRVTQDYLRDGLGPGLSFAEVDRDALAAFERFLRLTKKNSPNTVRNHLKRLRRVYREALREGVIRPNDDPFAIYTMPKSASVQRRKLTYEQIQTLSAASLPPGSTAELARDVFAFAFYAAGMRFSDVASLRVTDVRDGNRLTYTMMKTGSPVAVTLPPPAAAIVTKYAATADDRGGLLFPLIALADTTDPVQHRKAANRANSRINAALQRLVAPAAEIDPDGLTMHIARHSFADHGRRSGGNLHDISKALGHKSLSITQAYLASFDIDAADRLASAMWIQDIDTE